MRWTANRSCAPSRATRPRRARARRRRLGTAGEGAGCLSATIRSASIPRRCGHSATGRSTCSSRTRPACATGRRCGGLRRRRCASGCRRPPGRAARLRGVAGRARARRPAVHEPLRPSRLLRVHPGVRHVPGRARGLHRQRAEHLRRLVDGGGRAEPARAAGARLFKQWIGYPEQAAGVLVSGGSAANMTALACAREALVRGTPDRCRPAAMASRTCPTRRIRRSRVRRGRSACGPTSCACCPRDERHRMRLDALAGAIAADALRGPAALLRRGLGGVDEHRGDRRAAGVGRDLPGARARGSTSTRRTAGSRR